jgi:hypothetical protein
MSLQNVIKLGELGTLINPRLRVLGAAVSKVDGQALAGYLHDLNSEKMTQWDVRTYATSEKPHRRFLVCADRTIITSGLSLNNLNKDEVLEVIPANDELARHDRDFFEEKWKLGAVLR